MTYEAHFAAQFADRKVCTQMDGTSRTMAGPCATGWNPALMAAMSPLTSSMGYPMQMDGGYPMQMGGGYPMQMGMPMLLPPGTSPGGRGDWRGPGIRGGMMLPSGQGMTRSPSTPMMLMPDTPAD